MEEKKRKLSRKLSKKKINEIEYFDELTKDNQYLVVKNGDIGSYLVGVDDADYQPKLLTFQHIINDKATFLDNDGSTIEFDTNLDLKDEDKINIWEIQLPGHVSEHIFSFLNKKGERKGGRKIKKSKRKGGKRKKNRKSKKN
jgi:hypothetical protein